MFLKDTIGEVLLDCYIVEYQILNYKLLPLKKTLFKQKIDEFILEESFRDCSKNPYSQDVIDIHLFSIYSLSVLFKKYSHYDYFDFFNKIYLGIIPLMSYKVLIADDEFSSQKLLSNILEKYEFLQVVRKVSNGKDLVKYLIREDYDLVFLDIEMPELSGIEAIEEVIKSNKKLPYIIFVSTYSHLGAKAFDIGAVDYLVKPATDNRVDIAVNRFLKIAEIECNKPLNLKAILSEDFNLTSREIDICQMVKEGIHRDEIQESLLLSKGTFKTHLTRIYEKLGLVEDKKKTGRNDKFSRLIIKLFSFD